MNEAEVRVAIIRTEEAMRLHLRRTIPQAGVFSFGAVDIHAKHLAFWVSTATDAKRDALIGDPPSSPCTLPRRRRLSGRRRGDRRLHVDPEETVQRDWAGWRHRVK